MSSSSKRRPARDHHLYQTRGKTGPVIWYIRQQDGRRIRRSTGTNDWAEARAWRDMFERRLGEEQQRALNGHVPTFAEVAADYVTNGMRSLAPCTAHDRSRLLRPDGPLVKCFGNMDVDEIQRADLLRWWERDIEGNGLTVKTGRNHLDALSGVFGRADDLYELDRNPVDAARSALRRRNRGKMSRAEAHRVTDTRQPLETAEDVDAFVAASAALHQEAIEEQMAARSEGRRARRPDSVDGHMLDIILLDAGLRLGEACALQWCDLTLPEQDDDPSRVLEIRRALSRGKFLGPPKSGRPRSVQMSRRLYRLLRRRYERAGRPAADEWIFAGYERGRDRPSIDEANYRKRHFARVCERAGLGHRKPKDLRDTYASHLLSAGVQLAYISQQLGHANTDVTASSYARWCGGLEYREPMHPEQGEVPADLLARLGAGSSQKHSSQAPGLARS